MEVDEKPTEDYTDVGGLDKQIQELVEAVERPITHNELFKQIGIKPPKGVLLWGPPGTGQYKRIHHQIFFLITHHVVCMRLIDAILFVVAVVVR